MPGFELAKLCHMVITKNHKVEGLILLNHGIFTFGSSAKQSYNRMIKLVTLAENFLNKQKKSIKYNKNNKQINITDVQLCIRNLYYSFTDKRWIIKFNNKIIHQSKLLNYFVEKKEISKIEKETNDLLKNILKDII